MKLWYMDKFIPHTHTHTHTHTYTYTYTQVGTDKVRPALTLVGYEEELRPAMAYVFGSMFVCDTLQNAKKVYIQDCVHGRVFSFVSLLKKRRLTAVIQSRAHKNGRLEYERVTPIEGRNY